MQSLPDEYIPNDTHPAKNARLAAVAKGWYDAQTETLSGPRIESSVVSTLTLSSSPSGAEVYLDGEYLGVTPLEEIEVDAGEHSLRLAKEGYNEGEIALSVELGKELSHHYTLSTVPIAPVVTTGTLSVKSMPSGARVYVDGGYVGNTPLSSHVLEGGRHTIKLSKVEHEDVDVEIRVRAGQDIEREYTLTEVVTSNPVVTSPPPSNPVTSPPPPARPPVNDGGQPVSSNADWTSVEQDFNGATMVLVPSGSFMMGSEDSDFDEKPVHIQSFDSPFWIDKIEVTKRSI